MAMPAEDFAAQKSAQKTQNTSKVFDTDGRTDARTDNGTGPPKYTFDKPARFARGNNFNIFNISLYFRLK